jgi:hypothetical protein
VDNYAPYPESKPQFMMRAERKGESRRSEPRRIRRASLALAVSRLEREHVALLLALCELEAPGHDGDPVKKALLPLIREDLRQTQHALARLARGEYGTCEECHRQLSARLLELRSAATLCPACEGRSHRGTMLD